MLWLCIHLPFLPLDVFQRGGRDDEPFAVIAGALVLIPNNTAARAGVQVGMRLTAAQALLPRLHRRERDPATQAQALERLAGWALQFTTQVSPQPPQSLLLEIGGSLRYFGGLEGLRGQLRSGLEGLGYRHVLGIAPTPTAACLLARAGHERPVTRENELREALAEQSVQVLDLEEKQHAALHNLGLHTLGGCLALPRNGLARRLGPDLIRQLDRALGHLPEPRRNWQAPPRFHSKLELPAEVTDTARLLFGPNRLILELCGYLQGIEAGIQRFQLDLHHRRQAATPLSIGLLAPSRDPEHLLDLARHRLERVTLPAPVTLLKLSARHIDHLSPTHRSLITAAPGDDPPQWGALVERLAARLGEHAVQGLQIREAHRPEYAWQYIPPGRESPGITCAERPLWLLPQPLPLQTSAGRPFWHGPLILQQDSERIETGWWDGAGVARDYYIAGNPAGERVWIFRERRGERAWYLHGVFA